MRDIDVPLGFRDALVQNEAAANAYAMMTPEEKEAVLEKAQKARTKRKMQKIVSGLEQDQVLE